MKRFFLFLFMLYTSNAIAAYVELQPDESGKDIIIRSYIQTESFDSYWLYTRNDDILDLYWTMIEFDLSAVSVQSVNQATLNLYCYAQEATVSPTVYANRITAYWDEETVNWASHGTAFTTDGRVPQSETVSVGWVTWDVTTMVNDWLNTSNGIDNYGFMLTTDLIQPDNRTFYYGSDYNDNPDLRPMLTLEFADQPAIPEPLSLLLFISSTVGLIFQKKIS